MATIPITDDLKATASIQMSDDAPLWKSLLTSLHFSPPLVGVFDKPVQEVPVKEVAFGAEIKTPSALIANAANLLIKTDVSGDLSISRAADETLFDDDGFSPTIPIAPNECWMGIELNATLDSAISGTIDGFGVGVEGISSASFATYTLLQTTPAGEPTLKEAIGKAFETYSINYSAAAVRKQPPGTVNVNDVTGTVTFSGSYSLPINVNPLASADLPFNHKIEIKPAATLEIGGEIALTGEFIVRSYRVSASELHFGVYKKKGVTLTATFTAAAGIEADNAQGKDLISPFLKAVLPAANARKAGISGDTAIELNHALKDCLDRSLSIAMNVACSAGHADEAAVLYSINLDGGQSGETDAAIASALKGDWTLLDALPNAKPLRNVLRATKESKQKININLLGIYNATTVDDYVASCTILHDENGQLTVTDKVKASRIAAATTPFGADADKLRKALAEATLATLTYAAASTGAQLREFSVNQTYFRYKADMSPQEMGGQIRLGNVLRVLPEGTGNSILAGNSRFAYAKIGAIAQYDTALAMKLFFADSSTRVPRQRQEFERAGRASMLALLDPHDAATEARRSALTNDAIWSAMDASGNVATFSGIPGVQQQFAAAIGADWIDIAWWTDAMVKVAPKLSDLLLAVENCKIQDLTQDLQFMKARDALVGVLGAVARNSRSAFGDGWGMAVMFSLTGGSAGVGPEVTMDIGWNSINQHFLSNPKSAVAGAPGLASSSVSH